MSKKNDMKSINDSDSETFNKKKDGYFGRMSAKVPIPKGDFVGVKSAKDFTSYPGEWVKLACEERGISNEQLEKAILDRKLRIVTSDGDVLNPPPAEFIKHLVSEALSGNYEFCRPHADSFFKIDSEFITDKAIQKVKKNEANTNSN